MLESNLKILKEFEGFRSEAYICSGGEVTLGYGCLYDTNYKKFKLGDTLTQEEANDLLLFHIGEFEKGLNVALKDIPLHQNCKDAITMLCFNIGITAFLKSTLYKEIQRDKNNLEAIQKQWLRWCYADGKKLKGLENRRKAEFDLYKKGILNQYSKSEIYDKYVHKCNLK